MRRECQRAPGCKGVDQGDGTAFLDTTAKGHPRPRGLTRRAAEVGGDCNENTCNSMKSVEIAATALSAIRRVSL